jgi:hypothetical protein
MIPVRFMCFLARMKLLADSTIADCQASRFSDGASLGFVGVRFGGQGIGVNFCGGAHFSADEL